MNQYKFRTQCRRLKVPKVAPMMLLQRAREITKACEIPCQIPCQISLNS